MVKYKQLETRESILELYTRGRSDVVSCPYVTLG